MVFVPYCRFLGHFNMHFCVFQRFVWFCLFCRFHFKDTSITITCCFGDFLLTKYCLYISLFHRIIFFILICFIEIWSYMYDRVVQHPSSCSWEVLISKGHWTQQWMNTFTMINNLNVDMSCARWSITTSKLDSVSHHNIDIRIAKSGTIQLFS